MAAGNDLQLWHTHANKNSWNIVHIITEKEKDSNNPSMKYKSNQTLITWRANFFLYRSQWSRLMAHVDYLKNGQMPGSDLEICKSLEMLATTINAM